MTHKRARIDLAAEYVRQILEYNPLTGEFTWRPRTDKLGRRNVRFAGKPAGCVFNGYLLIGINYKIYLANRLAHLMMTGSWPEFEIDHKDGDPSNNRWSNLRPATSSQNIANQGPQANNTSGYKGVSFSKVPRLKRRWVAQITVNRRTIHIGSFETKEAAAAAYAEAAVKYQGEFARTQ